MLRIFKHRRPNGNKKLITMIYFRKQQYNRKGSISKFIHQCLVHRQMIKYKNQFVLLNNIIISLMNNLIILSLLLVSIHLQSIGKYRKIVHNIDPEAKCLDGSSPALYLHEGDPKNILIYFMSGGSCSGNDISSTLQNCYERSLGGYGSSLYWPQTKIGQGILSTDKTKNIFAGWTKALLLYCDGFFHQGYAKDPIKFKDSLLYFRGSLNTRSHFKYLNTTFNLSNANRVVLSGSSAGGMATYIWADYLNQLLPSEVQYYAIPDSSIFLDPQIPQYLHNSSSKKNLKSSVILFPIANKDEGVPNRQCAKGLGKNNEVFCLDIQGALPFLQTQTLFLQSSYDSYIIQNGANIKCLVNGVSGNSLKQCNKDDLTLIENYRTYYMKFLEIVLKKGHNVWTISCSWHATALFDKFYESALQKVPEQTGLTMQEAAYRFIFQKEKIVNIDVQSWPSNGACAY